MRERLFVDRFSLKLWKKTWKAAGLPRVKSHDLRRTFASLLVQKGVSTAVTQRLLEHSSLRRLRCFGSVRRTNGRTGLSPHPQSVAPAQALHRRQFGKLQVANSHTA